MAYRLRYLIPVDIPAVSDRHGSDVSGEEILVHLRRQIDRWQRMPEAFLEDIRRGRSPMVLDDETSMWVLADPATGRVVETPGSGFALEDLAMIRREGGIAAAALPWEKAAATPPGPYVWMEIEDLPTLPVLARVRGPEGMATIDLRPWLRNRSTDSLVALAGQTEVDAMPILRELAADFHPVARRILHVGLGEVGVATALAALRAPPPDRSAGALMLEVDREQLCIWLRDYRALRPSPDAQTPSP